MIHVPLADIKDFDVVTVNGTPYMFTNLRIARDSVPGDLYVYSVRGDDETTGGFANIKQHVVVNHWGDLIGKEPLLLDEMGTYWCEDDDGCGIGEYVESVREYLEKYEKFKEEAS